ncbi:Tn3 family transposase [Streptomyces sp. NPDC052042]|uniref:Tn3 family transposase n=1 Tax=Streptomyces sp. NPDC052042 TaxID=3365683 RepID=UPI0037D873F3
MPTPGSVSRTRYSFAIRSTATDAARPPPDRSHPPNDPEPKPFLINNTLDIADIVRELQAEGWKIEPEDLAEISPYLTEHIMRFGEYSTHELSDTPEAYEVHLDVDLTQLDADAGPEAEMAA